jgi:hypothetical protein
MGNAIERNIYISHMNHMNSEFFTVNAQVIYLCFEA